MKIELYFLEADSFMGEAPFFVERFEEQFVPQKGTITLEAKVSGNPVPEIMWYQDNLPLEPSDRIQQFYDGEDIKLNITKANSDIDSGNYKCVATNPFGIVSHGARVIVEVDDVIFTKKLKKTVTIEESQNLTLECETSHIVSTKWLHNDKELSGMDHRVVVENGKVHRLFIKHTALKDAGLYMCTIKGHSTESKVEVLEKPAEFTRIMQDIEVKENEPAILEVEISSDSVDVDWFKDGEPLTANDRIEFVKDGKVRRLIIRDCSIHDEGEYTCSLGDDDCKAEITIIEKPPRIVKGLADLTVTKGEKAVFEVELSKGDALVKWFKGKSEITISKHVQLSIDGKKQKLKIYKSEMNDTGDYNCSVGDDTSSAKLTVIEPSVNFIIKLPEVTLVTKTHDAEFTVELSSPEVELTWFKNGKPIKPNDKFEISVEKTIRKLIIHNTTDDDEAEYSCQTGNVESKSSLKVEGNFMVFLFFILHYYHIAFYLTSHKSPTYNNY